MYQQETTYGYLPDFEECPAPNSHLNNSSLLSVFISLNFATNLAGSEYKTRGSVAIHIYSVRKINKITLKDMDIL